MKYYNSNGDVVTYNQLSNIKPIITHFNSVDTSGNIVLYPDLLNVYHDTLPKIKIIQNNKESNKKFLILRLQDDNYTNYFLLKSYTGNINSNSLLHNIRQLISLRNQYFDITVKLKLENLYGQLSDNEPGKGINFVSNLSIYDYIPGKTLKEEIITIKQKTIRKIPRILDSYKIKINRKYQYIKKLDMLFYHNLLHEIENIDMGQHNGQINNINIDPRDIVRKCKNKNCPKEQECLDGICVYKKKLLKDKDKELRKYLLTKRAIKSGLEKVSDLKNIDYSPIIKKPVLEYLGGKKQIRKHKGINQKTGKLNKGYKYSGKKLKTGLKEIVKK